MIARARNLLAGDGLRARALRGTAYTFLGFGAQQFLRLLSNLVLTRLLFPEAFGLMALVMVVLTGLQMFSDTGINTSIVQNKRGDDPAFLGTAWSVQIGRGVLLWGLTLALALPMAAFYDQPQLAALLPVAGFSMVILGFQSMRIATANRHLALGRLTALELGSQALGIAVMVMLAFALQTVWALVIGTLVTGAAKTTLSHLILPGPRDQARWDKSAFSELFHFGKYIFLGSIAGFAVNNADRAVLGKFITIGELGIYNIGFFMASVPLMVCFQLGTRVLMPVCSKTPPGQSADNFRKVRLARAGLSAGLVALGLLFAVSGEWVIDLLYSDTYALAGPVMVLLSLTYLPTLVLNAYGSILLAAGNSRHFTLYLALQGAVQLALLIWLVQAYGIFGAALAPGLAALLAYPLLVRFLRRVGGWDPALDAAFLVVITAGTIAVLTLHDGAIAAVMAGLAE